MILGSLVTIPLYIFFIALIPIRALREEAQLVNVFPEYTEYMRDVKQQINPYVY